MNVACAVMNELSSCETSNVRVDSSEGNKSLKTTSKFAKLLLFNTCRVASEKRTSYDGAS